MAYHFREYLKIESLLDSSYLAVDLFFMMSGFVLAHAYGNKLRSGMTFRQFLLVRMIRLYPVYFAATCLGISYYIAKICIRTDDAPIAIDIFKITALNSVFVPSWNAELSLGGMFPFSPTSWSLSVEMIVSIIFASTFYKKNMRILIILFCFSTLLFVNFAINYNTVDLGWEIKTYIPSIFRATAEFIAGLMIYKYASIKLVADGRRWIAGATFGALIFTMVLIPSGVFISLFLIAFLFPLTIYWQSRSEPDNLLAWLCHQLGRGSYPIYLLHTPVLLWGIGLVKSIAPAYTHSAGYELGIYLMLITLFLSYLCADVDERVRRRLNAFVRRLNLKKST